jgi:hypothetical protein
MDAAGGDDDAGDDAGVVDLARAGFVALPAGGERE